jgi:hypothetical protein
LKIRPVALIIIVLIPVMALELVFAPVDRVLASPPNIPLETCTMTQVGATPVCKFAADYYAGGGSLTYCFLGEGALYLKGVYYPLTQPGASPARDISEAYCPAMHR